MPPSPSRPSCLRRDGRTVQRLRARSRERPRRSSSRRTVSQRRPLGPQCPGSWLRSNGASAQSPDPPQGPATPPVHGRQRHPPFRADAFGSVQRGLEHGRDRLRSPGQCPASDEPGLEDRVQALTGPAPRHEFHPGLPLQFAGSQDLAYVDDGLPVVQLQSVAYVSRAATPFTPGGIGRNGAGPRQRSRCPPPAPMAGRTASGGVAVPSDGPSP